MLGLKYLELCTNEVIVYIYLKVQKTRRLLISNSIPYIWIYPTKAAAKKLIEKVKSHRYIFRKAEKFITNSSTTAFTSNESDRMNQ